MRYQESWVRGKNIGEPAQRPCAPRYTPIKKFLTQYKRPFSVFDLGANMGYFCFRIAADFPDKAACVAVDAKPELVDLTQKNGMPHIMVLPMHIRGEGLWRLSECEHFDVVLALSVLHHIPDWQLAINALVKMSDHLIVEVPPRVGDENALNPEFHAGIYDKLMELEPTKIGSFPSHRSDGIRSMLLHSDPGGHLIHQTLDAAERGAPECDVTIQSDFEKATCTISHGGGAPSIESREFVPGMNLWNWRQMHGATPTLSSIRKALVEVGGTLEHDDLQPWNFVLNGQRIIPIDHDNKTPDILATRKIPLTMERVLEMFAE